MQNIFLKMLVLAMVLLANLTISETTFAIVMIGSAQEGKLHTPSHGQGEMAGEVTINSVILQSRLTLGDSLINGDLPGCNGMACFEISTVDDFADAYMTEWVEAREENDFIVKTVVTGLKHNTRYYYRLIYGANKKSIQKGNTCTFKTLQGHDGDDEVSFVVVTGMNYAFFHYGRDGKGNNSYKSPDKNLGFPGLESILKLKPDFFVGTGDNVYYDHPKAENLRAKSQEQLRRKWHEQFIQPRFRKLFTKVPIYWEKDDHDHRYDDSDTTGSREPFNKLGIATFLEQVPVVDPQDPGALTYRTHRINKHLQIWLVEGRNYRSPNSMPDGPDKSIWGKEQKEWLKDTLLESDATFKILISPTPLVGPDRANKKDNHTNPNGFHHEGREFLQWLRKSGFLKKHLYIICGDRHWQYHAIDPTGIEEFSCGALVDANSIIGTFPGDPKSNDPNAAIVQPLHPKEASGGFLYVTVKPGTNLFGPSLYFSFYDEKGKQLYHTLKVAE